MLGWEQTTQLAYLAFIFPSLFYHVQGLSWSCFYIPSLLLRWAQLQQWTMTSLWLDRSLVQFKLGPWALPHCMWFLRVLWENWSPSCSYSQMVRVDVTGKFRWTGNHSSKAFSYFLLLMTGLWTRVHETWWHLYFHSDHCTI